MVSETWTLFQELLNGIRLGGGRQYCSSRSWRRSRRSQCGGIGCHPTRDRIKKQGRQALALFLGVCLHNWSFFLFKPTTTCPIPCQAKLATSAHPKLNWGSLASSSSSSRSLLPNEEELNERKIAEVISKGLISASSSSFDLSVASSVGFQFYLVSFPFLSPLCSH